MKSALNATRVRANFGEFIDSVIRERPQAVKRNRDIIIATSVEQMRVLLTAYELNFEYEVDEDGRFAGSIEEIDFVVGDGQSLDELRSTLARQLIEYANDYMADYPRYVSTPNTKIHAPYVLRILLEDDAQSVASMLHGDAELA